MRARGTLVRALVVVAIAVPGCQCNFQVGKTDLSERLEAADRAIHVIFHGSMDEVYGLFATRARAQLSRSRIVMTTSWWRAVLGECTKFDSSRFNQWALPDGQSGVDGNMKCRSGLVPIRLAFMKENDRLLLTGVEARFPEKVAKVLVTPDEAEAFTKAMVAKLDDGGIPAFHSAVLGAAAADDVAPPAVINAITEKIGKVSRWEVVDRKPTLTASQETFFLWHGEGTPVQVILDVVKLDGVLRVSGLRWRAAPEAMKH